MPSLITEMTLGDIFDKSIRLIGKTFSRNVAISVSFIILPVILMTIAANRFYSTLPGFTTGTAAPDISMIGPMVSVGFYFGFASLLFAVAALFAEIAISVVIAGELNDERVTYSEAVKMTFERRWLNGIGEGLLKTLAIVGAVLFVSILAVIIGVTSSHASSGGGGLRILFTVLFIIVLICAIVYCVLRLYFALTAVAVQDLGPIEALKKSWLLVGGYWWRTLGILILFFILSGFATSVITVPITFGSMWGQYKTLFTTLSQSGGQMNPADLRNLQAGLGHVIGIASGVSSMISLLLTPAFTVVMYFDLRARHNDFPSESTANAQEVPVTTI